MNGVIGVLFVICWIGVLVLYHSVFTVYYGDLFHGFMKELVGAFIIAVLLTGLILYLWFIPAILLLLAGFRMYSSKKRAGVLVLFIVLAIIVSITGISFRATTKENSAGTNSTTSSIEYSVKQLI